MYERAAFLLQLKSQLCALKANQINHNKDMANVRRYMANN